MKTREVTSDYYGRGIMRYLGTVDLLKSPKEYAAWAEKWHPYQYFSAYWGIPVESFSTSLLPYTKYEVWIYHRDDNLRWRPGPETPYLKALSGRRPRYHPLSDTKYRVDRWLRASKAVLLDATQDS